MQLVNATHQLQVGIARWLAKEISAAPLVRLMREFKPQVLVTYDENGGYPHPDHIRCHDISMLAFEAAADASQYPDAGPAWQISKVYYDRIFSVKRMESMYDLLVEEVPDSPLITSMVEMRERMKGSEYKATTQVPAGAFFEVRDNALRSHTSQVSGNSSFFFMPNDIQQRAWPFEDFELVKSLVPTEMPEVDLFAGIEDDENA